MVACEANLRARVIALVNAGGDTINSMKQAAEFGIVARQALGPPWGRRSSSGYMNWGRIEGRTIEIHYRWGEDHPECFDQIAAEFLRRWPRSARPAGA
jgi:hypothetical protein